MSGIVEDLIAQTRWNELDQQWEWQIWDPFHKIAIDEGVSETPFRAEAEGKMRLFQLQHAEWEPKEKS